MLRFTTMFERFTDKARRVVVLAQEEARLFKHDYIGTEHLILGLLREGEGMGPQVLAQVGLGLGDVRSDVERRVGIGHDEPKGHIPFTPRAKQVLELSLRQALQLGHTYIGTEHILLGILEEGQGVAAQILIAHDVFESARDVVMMKLVESGAVPDPEQRRAAAAARARTRTHVSMSQIGDRNVIVRLEAIEARLSAIEALLRAQGEEREAQ